MAIEDIKHRGVLIHECDQDGERRADKTIPAHPNGIPVSKDRWLLVYATRRFRGNDDDCSIIYQIRQDTPDGTLLREGLLAQATDDWRPGGLSTGVCYKKLHRHPTAFGVPKGAFIAGREPAHANVIVLQWIRVAREFDPEMNYVQGTDTALDPAMVATTQVVEWTQVRLNETGDDIETIRPIAPLRQVGYESGPAICSVEDARWTTTRMQPAIPYNENCTEWVETACFDGARSAARKYRFNASKGFYEWLETGPLLTDGNGPFGGGVLVPLNEGWAAVQVYSTIDGHVWFGRGLGWARLEDPFAPSTEAILSKDPVRPQEPASRPPVTFYLCADGVLRCFGGDGTSSPYGIERNPLYCWEIDPDDGFQATERRVVYDTFQAGLPIRLEARPMLDMCKLLPFHGSTQYLVHRVIATSMFHEHTHTRPEFWIFPPLNRAEFDSFGIYYAAITYDEVNPPPWNFPSDG